MAASQQTIEQRLAEFTEVHGTVLLGMHRELQSQLATVDDKLAVATQALRADADRARDDLTERARQVDERYGEIAAELEKTASSFQQRDAALTVAMESHSVRIADVVRLASEDSARTRRELSELVATTRSETGALVEAAAATMNQRLQSVGEMFKESYTTFTRQLEAAEAKVLAYMVRQQQLLDGQAQQIQTLHARTQQLLDETDTKIDAHQRREAEFNRNLRQSLLVLAVVTCVAVAFGVWKPWIS